MPTGFPFFTKVMEQVLRQTILLLYQVQDPLNPFNVVGFAFLEAFIEACTQDGPVFRAFSDSISLPSSCDLHDHIADLQQPVLAGNDQFDSATFTTEVLPCAGGVWHTDHATSGIQLHA